MKMRIKNVKPGDIIKIRSTETAREKEAHFFDNKWKVIKVFENHVLAHSVRVPAIRRSFCYGDLVMLHLEGQEAIKRFEY